MTLARQNKCPMQIRGLTLQVPHPLRVARDPKQYGHEFKFVGHLSGDLHLPAILRVFLTEKRSFLSTEECLVHLCRPPGVGFPDRTGA